MLFSEPKIPQLYRRFTTFRRLQGFSALQRAENSSIEVGAQARAADAPVSVLFSEPKIPQFYKSSKALDETSFQCSSASRKFLNANGRRGRHITPVGFSALQRAENSSIVDVDGSAGAAGSFSALQRAENSSMQRAVPRPHAGVDVSVLFSEPKIPQCQSSDRIMIWSSVSVLFSEPKIPQWRIPRLIRPIPMRFSALQRAENSSMAARDDWTQRRIIVSVLFSEPKIPQYTDAHCGTPSSKRCFSALQRAENSSIYLVATYDLVTVGFSALQRAENSSMVEPTMFKELIQKFQCSSASRKFLNRSATSDTPIKR